MKKAKKTSAGFVRAIELLSGANATIGNVISVKIVVHYRQHAIKE
jgi:hypothetical protein